MGSDTGKMSPLASWRVSGMNRRAVGSLGPTHEGHADAYLLPKKGGLKTAQPPWHVPQPEQSKHASSACFRTQHTLEHELPRLRRKLSWETQGRLKPEAASESGRGIYSWHLHRQHVRGPNLGLRPDHQSLQPYPGRDPTQAPPALQHSSTPG